MFKNVNLAVLGLAAMSVFGAVPAAAQVTTADVVGHVSDPKGLAVVGAKVKVSSQATGFLRETSTSELGDFAVTLIPPAQGRQQRRLRGSDVA